MGARALSRVRALTTCLRFHNAGDAALNSLFRDLYARADDDTRRAMVKSYTESGGTALSTDWRTVGKAPVKVEPPEGMVARKFGE